MRFRPRVRFGYGLGFVLWYRLVLVYGLVYTNGVGLGFGFRVRVSVRG